MRIVPTAIPDVRVLEPEVHRDDRGAFWETWRATALAAAGIRAAFVQGNRAVSAARVLRGLHAQARRPQGKLVRVVRGAVFDVAVDLRRASPTFRRWVSADLDAANRRECWIPPGFAHGYVVTSDGDAEVEYECTNEYDASDEIRIAWDDPDLGIRWPVTRPFLSPKDAAAPRLRDVLDRLPP